MQDPANELPRILLPRTPVNKGKRKGRALSPASQVYSLSDTSSPTQAPKCIRNHSAGAGGGQMARS
jgi:hypothetical protein